MKRETRSLENYCQAVYNYMLEEYDVEDFRSKKERQEHREEKKEKRKEKRDEEGNVFERIGKGIKKTIGTVGKIGILLPFKGAMKKALKNNGIPFKDNMDDITEKFYNFVIKKKGSNNYLSLNSNGNENHIAAELIDTAISAIVTFFRALKEKKKRGEKLEKWEEDAINTVEAATDMVVDAAKDQAKYKIGDILTNPVVLICIGLFLFMRK